MKLMKEHSIENIYYGILLIVSLVYISLSLHLPVSILTTANYDDALFFNNAISILKGSWLGEYNELTLLKGVGFSLFLALNALIGVPVTFSISIFFMLSTLLFIKVLRDEFGIGKIVAIALLLIILFHPLMYPTRIIRDDIYPALTMLAICGFIKLFRYEENKFSLLKFIPYGIFGGLFWLTREEGVWILPGFAILLVAKIAYTYKDNSKHLPHFRALGVYALSLYLPIAIVSSINYFAYGRYITSESFISSGPYADVLRVLNSIDAGPEIQHVPVSYSKRMEAYKVSPSFLEVKEYLDGKGNFWTKPGCDVYPETCGDYAGGWFMFALRTGTASIGYYKSPEKADNYYRQIYNEITIGCENKLISCKHNVIPYMPRITKNQFLEIPDKLSTLLRLALVQDPVPPNSGPSWGPFDRLQGLKILLGNPFSVKSESENIEQADGWFYSANGDWIELACRNSSGIQVVKQVQRIESDDLMDYFNDKKAKNIRFTYNLFTADECGIRVQNETSVIIKTSEIMEPNTSYNLAGGQLYFNNVMNSSKTDIFYIRAYSIKNTIGEIYKLISPTIFYSGMVVYIFITLIALFRIIKLSPLYFVILALWGLLLSRMALLILIDISSFPALTPLYFGPGFFLTCSASILSIYYFFICLEQKHGEIKKWFA